MQILVTGSSGFLGRVLCKELRSCGHEVFEAHSKNCDLTLSDSLHQFNQQQFDQIYHLAVWTQAGDFCLAHPGEQWLINQKINTHMLDWWVRHQPQAKMISMGTSCAYDPSLPLIEENYLRGMPHESLLSYGMTKRMLLSGLISIQQQYGLKYLYLIPSTLYGPTVHREKKQLHFIFDLVRKILRGSLYGDAVVLWGDGHQKRELIHVRDFVSMALQLSLREENKTLNVGSGEEYSIRNFAEKICEIAKFPFEKIAFDLSRYVGARSKVLNVERLKALLPIQKTTPLEEGLKETIEWFRDSI